MEEERDEEEDVAWVGEANTDDFDDDISTQDGHQWYWDYELECWRREGTPPLREEEAADEEEYADQPSRFEGLWVWEEETRQWLITVQNVEELRQWIDHDQRPSWHSES